MKNLNANCANKNPLLSQKMWGPEYKSYEMLNDSMDDNSSRSICVGDLLKCKVIGIKELPDYAKEYDIVLDMNGSLIAGIVSDITEKTLTLSKYNKKYEDVTVDLISINGVSIIEALHRNMTPKAKAKRAKYRNK
jgi:hypothetical protein